MSNTGSLKIVPLDIDAMRKIAAETNHLYVINSTDLGRRQNRGEYFIEVRDDNNRAVGLKLPNTWIPIDLGSFVAEPVKLFRSDAFVEAIRKRLIVGISQQQRDEIMRRPDAQEEMRTIANAGNQYGIHNNEAVTIGTGSSRQVQSSQSLATLSDSTGAAMGSPSDNQLADLIRRFNQGNLDDDAAIEELRALSPPPSVEAVQDAAGTIGMTSSPFYMEIAMLISELSDGGFSSNSFPETGTNAS